MEASFSPILCWSPKKKVLCLSCATFLRDFCDIPERGAVNRGCLQFLAGNKNAGFWQEKNAEIRKILVRKCRKKFRTFRTFLRL